MPASSWLLVDNYWLLDKLNKILGLPFHQAKGANETASQSAFLIADAFYCWRSCNPAEGL